MVAPILSTKLHIPSLRRNRVPRQRLLERLDQGTRRRLTLVSAPAGFGKTTLLGEWVQRLEAGGPPPVKAAWISLDDGDNDPARFAAYLAAALQQREERTGQASGDAFELAGSRLQESHLVALINQVAALPQTLVLVLDDYHLITSQVIHDALTFLVDHLPENLHLVLATRADPPLPLPRLRARGHLTEIRQSDLRFIASEAATFLNDVMGLRLSAEDVAALETRTEGWIAGLQMAALSLQGHSAHPPTRSGFVQAFTGSHRFVLDYLVEEVLEQHPATIQEFLLKTSVLERLSGPLCDWMAGDGEGGEPDGPSTSQSILEYLDAANLFILPLDHERRWYRYHRLFADLLRKRLWQRSPELVPVLHRRASEWHEQQGLMAEAIDHALAAHDFERAATLIEESVEATLMRSEVTTFLGWLGRLPDEWIRSRPTLCFFHAWALLMSGGSMDRVEGRLQDMTCAPDAPESSGRVAALRAYLSIFQGDLPRAADLCRQALASIPERDRFLRNVVEWLLSLTQLYFGDLQNGKEALKEVVRIGQEIGNPMVTVTALCYRARLQMRQGRLHRAREILEQALQLATDPQGQRLPIASEALIGLADLGREWNDLDQAAAYLAESIELARQWSEMAAFDAYTPLARVRLAQGDVEGAREALETGRRIAAKSEITELDDMVSELQWANFYVSQGEAKKVIEWAERRGLLPGVAPEPQMDRAEAQDSIAAHLQKYEVLVLARFYVQQGRAAKALDLLEPLLAQARELARADLTIEIQILRAMAHQAEGREAQAMDALAEALSLAEPGGYARIFLDRGAPMAGLLRQAASQGITPAYVARLLAAFGAAEPAEVGPEPSASQAQPLIEPLSQRELEVLRLLAAGLSNPEIADELFVAVSTVRSHCKNIYGKLNVHRRWDAVQRAQELGLI